jgi:glycosyltransferase involved in cell wall biosynthesis
LFTPGDPDDLARSLAALVRDPAEAARLGAAGAAGVRRHYGLGRMADEMERVYSSLGPAARASA